MLISHTRLDAAYDTGAKTGFQIRRDMWIPQIKNGREEGREEGKREEERGDQ